MSMMWSRDLCQLTKDMSQRLISITEILDVLLQHKRKEIKSL